MKISHKGLLLVSVPLIFQIVFAVALVSVLQQAESEIVKQMRVQDLIATIESCQRHWTRGLCDTMLFVGTGDESFREDQRKCEHLTYADLNKLDTIIKLHPNQAKFLSQAKPLVTRTLQLERFFMTPLGLQLATKTLNGSDAGTKYAVWPLESIISQLKYSEKDATKQRQLAAERIELTLKAGILLSCIITVGLALYFNQDIVKRLKNVLVNVERLKNNQSPAKALSGSDEIADLDRVLFDSASEIIALEKFKEETIGIIGQQLRAPLCFIDKSFQELRATPNLTETTSEILAIGHRSSERLVKLINDLLDSAQMNAQGKLLNKERIFLRNFVQDSFNALKEFAAGHKIKLEYKEGVDTIYGDRERLTQVLVNLLSNAIKFSPPGSVVTVSASKKEDQVELVVSDSGRGIPEEQIAGIFEKFQQVESSDETEKGGTGLGLPITRSIIEQHGGIIEVDSVPGKGSRFSMKLPAQENSTPLPEKKIGEAKPRFQFKLSHKGFLLITVPLVSTMILAAVILKLSHDAEREVEQRFAKKEILATLGTISTKELDAVLIFAAQRIKYSPIRQERLEADRKQAHLLLERFRQLTENNPVQQEHYKQLKKLIKDVTTSQEEFMNTAEVNPFLHATESTQKKRPRFEDLDNLIEAETVLLSQGHNPSRNSLHADMYLILLALLAFNILLAVISVLIFSKGIIKSTNHIATNVKLLANRQKLDAPIKGSDELALIDQALTETAEHLSELREYKKQLIGIVSHELKTPLTSIKGSLELLLAGVYGIQSPANQEKLRAADDKAAQLIALIRDLLDIERIESGNLELRIHEEDMERVIEDAVLSIKDQASEKSIAIISSGSASTNTKAFCDSERLCQALTKILLAVINFSAHGGKIILAAKKRDSKVHIQIRDYGKPLTPGQKKQIFEKFSQAPDEENNYYLGIYLAKKIAEAQNGSLALEPNIEDGNSFLLSLPEATEKVLPETNIKFRNAG